MKNSTDLQLRHWLICTVALAILTLSTGCSNPCRESNKPYPDKWSAHPDLVMPGGTICKERSDDPAVQKATVGYAGFSVYQQIDDHLKSKGWKPVDLKLDSEIKQMRYENDAGDSLKITAPDNMWPMPTRAVYRYRPANPSEASR